MAFVYMLECSDGKLYTGWTTDLEARLKAHNRGTASHCTSGRLPVRLVYWEEVEDRSAALKREAAIKKLTRTAKLKLIAEREAQIVEEAIFQAVQKGPDARSKSDEPPRKMSFIETGS